MTKEPSRRKLAAMALPFVPRPEVEAALEARFASGANPVVVYGPPGSGKSALVFEWAATMGEAAHIVDVQEVTNEEGLADRIAVQLGAVEQVGEEAVVRLLRAAGSAVVVLDDCDRSADAVTAAVSRWRDLAPQVRWVTTSRQRLSVDGAEFVAVGAMKQQEALELFAVRAGAARPGFEVSDELRPIVEGLIAELDYLPLALELAAARASTLGPAEIARRLPQRFQILRGRGTTLEAAVALSWDLLDETERSVLAQCVVFRGGFGIDAAEAVVKLPPEGPWLVDVLESLVHKSLLRSVEPGAVAGEVRFEMLASIREYVAQVGEAPVGLVERHAVWALDSCRELTYRMRRRGGADARARLELEQSNLLAALERATDPVVLADLAMTLDKSFRLRGSHTRWESVLQAARAHETKLDVSRRALLRRAWGELQLLRGNFDEAVTALQSAAEDAIAADERVTLAWTHFLRGELERRRGRLSEALTHLEDAIEAARDTGIQHVERMALGHRAAVLVDVGRHAEARAAISAMERLPASDDLRDEAHLRKRVAYAQHYLGNVDEQLRLTREALELARESGDHRLEAICIQGLGDAAFVRGAYDEALATWAEALERHRANGAAEVEGALLGNLGTLQHRLNRFEEARRSYRDALSIHATTGAKPYEAVVWFGLGVLELEQGHFEDAAAALSRALELQEAIGNQSEIGSCRLVRAWIDRCRGRTGEEDLSAAVGAFDAAGDEEWSALAHFTAHPVGGSPEVEDETVRLCFEALAGQSTADRSRLHVRAACAMMLQVGGAPSVQASRRAALEIAPDASWFETDEGRVDLRRRKAPRHILARLLELRATDPGEAIDVYEAFEVGWPGEVATVEAAADRVYWAVRTLRKLGLEPFLMTNDRGYLLDPQADLRVV